MAAERCDRQTWDALEEGLPGNFFASSAWLELVCELLGAEPVYVVLSHKERPWLRLSFAQRRRLGVRLVFTPSIAPFAGCGMDDGIADSGTLSSLLDEFAGWCEHHASHAHVILPPEIVDVRPFTWRGWSSAVRYTLRLDLTDLSEAHLRRNHRRELKSARKLGLPVESFSDARSADAVNETLSATFEGHDGALPFPRGELQGYVERLLALESVGGLLVRGTGGEPLASLVHAFDAGRVYHLLAGLVREGQSTGAGRLAVWEALRKAAERVPEADFCGANMPGIADFKQGFGGKLKPYYVVKWTKGPWARLVTETAPRWKQKVRSR